MTYHLAYQRSKSVWLKRNGAPIEDQPIVFVGSEGEVGMVASNMRDYLWLLAGGVGPCEAIGVNGNNEDEAEQLKPNAKFTTLARKCGDEKSAIDVVLAARKEFPQFVEEFMSNNKV
jgi:hypothetical protein